jgi:hypothetical protein
MLPNRISAVMSDNDLNEVMSAIATIREKLPFLVSLTGDEIRKLTKMGDRSAFVEQALEVATQNLDILPRGFDVDEMRKDVDLHKKLISIDVAITQLMQLIDNTKILLGSEMYAAALVVYMQTKHLGAGAGLDALADDLGRIFMRKVKPAAEPAPAATDKA